MTDRMLILKAPARVEEFAKTADDWAAIQSAKAHADDEWADVCWNALPCLEVGVPVRQALETGLYECGFRKMPA